METIHWKIEGMSCSNCALTISKYLEGSGLENVKLSAVSGDLSFDNPGKLDDMRIQQGIRDLGYDVVSGSDTAPVKRKRINRSLRYLLICLPFALLLLAPMIAGFVSGQGHPMTLGMETGKGTGLTGWLMRPWIQCLICLPVYIVGMDFFGRSAVKSLLNRMPNMNVLIAIGSTAAFFYSLAGTIFNLGSGYLFYETAALIIVLILFGNWLEDITMGATQRALNKLARSQKVMANMIAFDDAHQEQIFPVENSVLKTGDLILIRSGEQVPVDCKILWGEAGVDEAIVTGESLPVERKARDLLIGGSLIVSGTVKAQVTAAAKDSVLAGIVNLVKQAQGEKPPVQMLADRISAIFVPIVLGIAALCFVVNILILHDYTHALLRAIAVLVIACPCAMGLATPAAISVGLGRAAREGILFRHARGLESFKDIRQVVFDKTGTLTTGAFSIRAWSLAPASSPEEGQRRTDQDTETGFKRIAFSLEKYSNHPIAKCIATEWKEKDGGIRWKKIEEIKGLGMRGETDQGDIYQAGSYRIAAGHTRDDQHNVYLLCNDRLLGWIDVQDSVRPEAENVIRWLRKKKIRTILLSGDRRAACTQLGEMLGIDEIIAEQSPEQKMNKVAGLNGHLPTAMVGDGINDAPAMAKARIGISMGDASQLAMQTADVVLINHGLGHLPEALGLGKHSYLTIRQNLFWAFFYNVLAIPVAACGLLTPTVAALAMALSDVVLLINSVRLFTRKVI